MKHVNQILAILLTMLMLVSAVPFGAFAVLTDEQASCQHEWDPNIDTKKEYEAEAATCKHPAKYYLICKKCKVCAKDVPDAVGGIKEYQDGPLDMANHEGSIVPVKTGDDVITYPCQTAGWTAGKKCSACNTVLEQPVQYTVVQNHKVEEGKEANCMSAAFCVWCGAKVAEKNPNNHAKDQIREQQPGIEPTCGTDGRKAILYCRNCDKVIQTAETISATGNHTPKTPATCMKKAVCSVCEQEYGEKDPNNHNLEKIAGVAASCTEAGNKEYWKCKDCGKYFSDAQGKTEITDKNSVVLPADSNTHKNLKKISAKAATCYETGMKEHWYCDACLHYYADKDAKTPINQSDIVLEKVPHTFGDWQYPENYDCAVGGELTRTCKVAKCGFVEKKTANPGEHVDRKTDKAVDATCTTAGMTERIYCGKCGVVLQESTEIPALGHDYENAQAAGNGDGTHSLTCNRCKLPGDPVPCVDEQEPRDCKCDVCGQQMAHSFTNYVPDGNATCAADGTKTAICDVCGVAKDTITDEGTKEKASHQYEWSDMNDATCITNAHRKGVCTVCSNEVLQEIPDSALGHEASDWLYPEGFDCTVGGNRYKECIRCHQPMGNEPIEGRAHTIVIVPGKKKTCTEDGVSDSSYCSVCNKVIDEAVVYKAEGHKPDDKGFSVTTAPTCKAAGKETATCSVCGKTFTRVIPAAGHKIVDKVVAPTCTKDGYTLQTCTVCGAKKTIKPTTKLGHKIKKDVTPATAKANGKIVQTCTRCGKTKTTTIYKIKNVQLSKNVFIYDGKAKAPTVIVTNTQGKQLKNKTHYKVKYYGTRKAVGVYNVVVTFQDYYKGKATKTFKIVLGTPKTLKAKADAKKQTITLNCSAVTGAQQYIFYYCTKANGSYKKLATTEKPAAVIKTLKPGTYYIKVRTTATLKNGTVVKSEPSAAVKVKLAKPAAKTTK